MLKKYDLEIPALNSSLEGQLVLGPLDESRDGWAPSKDLKEKSRVRYGENEKSGLGGLGTGSSHS